MDIPDFKLDRLDVDGVTRVGASRQGRDLANDAIGVGAHSRRNRVADGRRRPIPVPRCPPIGEDARRVEIVEGVATCRKSVKIELD